MGYDKASGKLAVTTTANQDPCVTTGLTPILGIDVWEHAYYLQYKNLRPDYVKSVWKIINWKVSVIFVGMREQTDELDCLTHRMSLITSRMPCNARLILYNNNL